MRASYAILLSVTSVSIHSLNCPKLVTDERGLSPVYGHAVVELYSGTSKVLGDFDFDVAQVSLARIAFPLLLGGIIRLRSAGRPSLHATIPVVGNKGFALILLGRPVGINIIDMRKIRFKFIIGQNDHIVNME